MKHHNPKGFAEDAARKLFRQIVEGVLFLHSQLILHRDIKLANLMLSKSMDIVRVVTVTNFAW